MISIGLCVCASMCGFFLWSMMCTQTVAVLVTYTVPYQLDLVRYYISRDICRAGDSHRALQYRVHPPVFSLTFSAALLWLAVNNVTTPPDGTEAKTSYFSFAFLCRCFCTWFRTFFIWSLTEFKFRILPPDAVLGQRGALHVDSLEVPAGLQVAYVVFEWAVDLETFSGALNPQRAGWQCCRDGEREAPDYLHTFQFPWQFKTLYFLSGELNTLVFWNNTRHN